MSDAPDPPWPLEEMRDWLRRRAGVLLDGRLRGKADASDVAQEALLRALRGLDQFRGQGEAELRTWLRRILARVVADAVRHYLGTDRRDARRERSLEQSLRESSARWELASPDATDGGAEHEETLLRLAERLEELPEARREALRLHYLEGLSVSETAGRLGRSVASTAGLLRRGLQDLRRELDDERDGTR